MGEGGGRRNSMREGEAGKQVTYIEWRVERGGGGRERS